MSTHKQAVRIRAVWRAGQQRQKVFAVDDLNGVGVIGCCDCDLIYFIVFARIVRFYVLNC